MLREEDRIELTAGQQRRDFIFIDDIVQAFGAIVDFSFKQTNGLFSFEVGSGQVISIFDFAMKVKELAGNKTTDLAFGALPYRANEVMESRVDLTNLTKLGWRPVVALGDGLKLTVEQEKINLLSLSGGAR